MIPQAIKPQGAAQTSAAHRLGHAELLLIEHGQRLARHEARDLTLSTGLAAIKGAKSESGRPLPDLPSLVQDMIVAKLAPSERTSLAQLVGGRLSPPAQASMLRKSAKAYGFIREPRMTSWQVHVEGLAAWHRMAVNRIFSGISKTEAILARLLLGAMSPQEAVGLCKNDRKVVTRAVEQQGSALLYASDALRGDREVVSRAVKQSGYAIAYASTALRGDRELVLCAVKQHGRMIAHASKALRRDREVVLCAVKENGAALFDASRTLRYDPELSALARGDSWFRLSAQDQGVGDL